MQTRGIISEMKSTTGQGAKGPWTRTALTINGTKFSTFNECGTLKVGDCVDVDFTQNGQYNNITTMIMTKEGYSEDDAITENSKPKQVVLPGISEKDLRITRMCAINNAVNLLGIIGVKGNSEDVLAVTKEISNQLIEFIMK